MSLFSLKKRKKARKLCMQALYQWQLSQADPEDIVQQFEHTQPMESIDREYFDQIFYGVVEHVAALDQACAAWMDRATDAIDPVELTVLRMGAYELKYQLDVPYRVVIHEACELQQCFGTAQGYQYVNAILDQLAKQHRPDEYRSADGWLGTHNGCAVT